MTQAQLCPEALLTDAIAVLRRDDAAGLARLSELMRDHDQDPRLPFLQGSVLAGLRRYGEAREAMARAVAMAPDYAIARFQLGFLEYTSGEPIAADRTWGALATLEQEHPLRLFSEGLRHLAIDDFETAFARLERGIANNTENPALNGDMRRLMDEMHKRHPGPEGDEPLSSTQMLLQQSGLRTRH